MQRNGNNMLGKLLMWVAATVSRSADQSRLILIMIGFFPSALLLWSTLARADADHKPVTQVVYRFDDHRYLELTGYECEGSVDYVDETRKIRTNVVSQYWRLYLGRYVHADHESGFIFIPYEDGSAFEVSKDNGRTFQTAHWVGYYPYGFPGQNNVLSITVVGQQAFIETRDRRLAMTSKPFGKRWGLDVIDRKFLPQTTLAEWPNFKNMPRDVPPQTNYHGWTEMHCNPDLRGEPIPSLKSFFNSFRKRESNEIQ